MAAIDPDTSALALVWVTVISPARIRTGSKKQRYILYLLRQEDPRFKPCLSDEN